MADTSRHFSFRLPDTVRAKLEKHAGERMVTQTILKAVGGFLDPDVVSVKMTPETREGLDDAAAQASRTPELQALHLIRQGLK